MQHAVKSEEVACDYCGKIAKLVPDSVVYRGRSYGGMVYYCEPCQAWVGTHRHDSSPLGRLAKSDLRAAKKEAHHYFDALWKTYPKNKRDWQIRRSKAYKWLSQRLDIPSRDCHIGMFDLDMCELTIDICKEYRNQKPPF